MKPFPGWTILLLMLLIMPATAQTGEKAFELSTGDKEKENYSEWPLAALKTAAKNGDPKAQSILGFRYYYGQGVRKSTLISFSYFLKAGKQGGLPAKKMQDFYLRGKDCLSCIHLDTGKFSMTLIKPNGGQRVVALAHLEKAVTRPENITFNRDITTFSGKEYKRLGLLMYTAAYQLNVDASGNRITLPMTDIKYIFHSDTGELVYDAIAQEAAARQDRATVEAYSNLIQNNLNTMQDNLNRMNTQQNSPSPRNYNCHYSGFGNINCIGF